MKYLEFLVVFLFLVLQIATIDLRGLWSEEVYALAAASGIDNPLELEEKTKALIDQNLVAKDISELLKIRSETSVLKTIQFLFNNDRHHFPAYYILLKYFGDLFGDSTAVLRSLSILFWLLSCFIVVGICKELEFNRVQALLSIAFFVSSPTIFFYGQMIREYSFWLFTILLSHWAFLKALREDKRMAFWVFYSFTLFLAFYTNLFSGMLPIIHLLTVLSKFKSDRKAITVKNYLLCLFPAVLLFSPLAYSILSHTDTIKQANDWAYPEDWSIVLLFQSFLQSLGSVFWSFSKYPWLELFIGLLVVFWFICFLVHVWIRSNWRLALLVLSVLVPIIAFLGHDFMRASIISTQNRYMLVFVAPLTLALGHIAGFWFARYKLIRFQSLSLVLISIFLFGSSISTFLVANSSATPLMRRNDQALAIQAMQKEKFDLIATQAGKSIHLWVGLARKLPPNTPWKIISSKVDLVQYKDKKIFLFLPNRKMKADESPGPPLANYFKIDRSVGFWLLSPL